MRSQENKECSVVVGVVVSEKEGGVPRCFKTIVYSGLCINARKTKVGILQKGTKGKKKETEEGGIDL